jgi:hypothetical protein
MGLDRTILGTVAAEQMEALEEAYGEDENAEIGAVITIVQVIKRIEDNEDEVKSTVRMRYHNIDTPYAAIGYLRAAEQGIVSQVTGGEE